MLGGQQSLWRTAAPAIDRAFATVRRIPLDHTAWLEHAPGWVSGEARLFAELERSTRWRRERVRMYDRTVDVPRLIANVPDDGPGHPLIDEMQAALAERYATGFPHVNLALYRDGNDSVAWHGDRVARDLDEAVIATVSLGEPRRFLIRPVAGGESRAFALGWGDLIVMGGSCQRTWRHAIPKQSHADPRMVIVFRPAWANY